MSPHFSLASYPPRHRLPCIVSRLLNDCPRAGLFAATTLSRPWNSVAATAWLGLAWLLPTLSTLSLLRQAKINWAESEVGAVSRFTTFHHFCLWEANAGGFTSHLTSPTTVFRTKYSIKGQHCNHQLISSTFLRLAHWLWHSWFHQSHLFSMLVLLLWHRGCLPDITGALFCCPGTLSGWFPVSPFAFVCCFKRPFCMFLSLNDILQPGASDHSVLYATAQLTEGRSARDQPKQPPAKKTMSIARELKHHYPFELACKIRRNASSLCFLSN